jgi:hypothetical protein
MLAYVFWHWKQPTVDTQPYEDWLRAFHTALAADPPDGFIRSLAYGLTALPWGKQQQAGYEDWYLVRDSAALDGLNDAAISARRQAPHDVVAGAAAGGTAGLYRLRQGQPPAKPARHATWLAKPDRMAYADFFERLRPLTEERSARLWGRQMTLGPTTEFCLHSAEIVQLPEGFAGRALELRGVWPE